LSYSKDKSVFVGLCNLERPAKDKTGFSVQPFLVKKAGGSRAEPSSLSADSEISSQGARKRVNFKQSGGLFERGKALKERAFPYPVFSRAASSRLQKGGLNNFC